MRVVIADDEKFVLVVLKSALRSVRFPIEIVGEALTATMPTGSAARKSRIF